MPQQVFPVMSAEQVDALIADQNLLMSEQQRARDVAAFLNAIDGWKKTAAQGAGKVGFVLPPKPTPPAGYTLIDVPEVNTAPLPLPSGVIGEPGSNGKYPDFGPQLDPAGMIVANPFKPGGQLVKVVGKTPWGTAHYWIEV